MKIDNRSIGKRIRQEREKLGISRQEFAEIITLSEYYVGQLERGERQMSLPVLVNISNCLHVSLDYLVGGRANQDIDHIREVQNRYDTSKQNIDAEIKELLIKCTEKELNLIKKLIKTILPYIKN